MICPKCGYESRKGALVCNMCGTLLRRADGTSAGEEEMDSGFAAPPGFMDQERGDPAPDMFFALDAAKERQAKKARVFLAAAAVVFVLAVAVLLIGRIPYSASKVDEMYADFKAAASSTEFPESFSRAFGHPRIDKQYIFQICHAFEEQFVKENPYTQLQEETHERLTAVKSGQPDPGEQGSASPDAAQEGASSPDPAVMKKIGDMQTVTSQVYGAGNAPFDTLRSVAGGDERGAEMREMYMDEVAGRKETQVRNIEAHQAQRRMAFQKTEEKVKQELARIASEESPKLASIARRMQERMFPGESAGENAGESASGGEKSDSGS